MNQKEPIIMFGNAILQELNRKGKKKYQLKEIVKRNDVKLHAITPQISTNGAGSEMLPTIYIEGIYENFQRHFYFANLEKQMEKISTEIEQLLADCNTQMPEDILKELILNGIEKRKTVEEKIFPEILNINWNTEFLKNKLFRKIGDDLAVIYHVEWSPSSSMIINESYAKLLGYSEEELYEIAKKNVAKEAYFGKMSKVLALMGFFEAKEDLLYFLGRCGQHGIASYGAGAILDDSIMERIYEKLGEDIRLIPSSIHEWIIVPNIAEMIEDFDQMIPAVNAYEVNLEEQLSDHIYSYDWNSREIRRV